MCVWSTLNTSLAEAGQKSALVSCETIRPDTRACIAEVPDPERAEEAAAEAAVDSRPAKPRSKKEVCFALGGGVCGDRGLVDVDLGRQAPGLTPCSRLLVDAAPDYLGRMWTHYAVRWLLAHAARALTFAGQGARGQTPTQCYASKKKVASMAGTGGKGVTRLRWYPQTAHLLLAASQGLAARCGGGVADAAVVRRWLRPDVERGHQEGARAVRLLLLWGCVCDADDGDGQVLGPRQGLQGRVLHGRRQAVCDGGLRPSFRGLGCGGAGARMLSSAALTTNTLQTARSTLTVALPHMGYCATVAGNTFLVGEFGPAMWRQTPAS